MGFTMDYTEYNKMIDFAKGFAAKKNVSRPIMEFIKINIEGDTATAEFTNGYAAAIIKLSINNVGLSKGSFFLPVTPKLKKADFFASFTITEKEVAIQTATQKYIYRQPEGEPLNVEKFFPTDGHKEAWGMNPVLLADALKAFKNDKAVRIEYRGETQAIVIKSDTAKAIVLPVRLGQGRK